MVMTQDRWYQIDSCHSASAYPANAVVPASRRTDRNGAPGPRAAPATYAAKIPTTTEYTNHRVSGLPIDIEPLGMIVNTITGPRLNFSMNAGDFISSRLAGRGIM